MALTTRHGTRYGKPILDLRPARKVVTTTSKQIVRSYFEQNIATLPKHRTGAWARDQILEEGIVAVSRRIYGVRKNPHKLLGEAYTFVQYFEER